MRLCAAREEVVDVCERAAADAGMTRGGDDTVILSTRDEAAESAPVDAPVINRSIARVARSGNGECKRAARPRCLEPYQHASSLIRDRWVSLSLPPLATDTEAGWEDDGTICLTGHDHVTIWLAMAEAAKKVTVNLPAETLGNAMRITGKGITETLIEGLRQIDRREKRSALRGLRGRVRLTLDLDKTRR